MGSTFKPDEVVASVMRHFTQLEVLWRNEADSRKLSVYAKVMRENLPKGVELEWVKEDPFSAKFHRGEFTYVMTARDNIIGIQQRKRAK
jgi:hypothetical protein